MEIHTPKRSRFSFNRNWIRKCHCVVCGQNPGAMVCILKTTFFHLTGIHFCIYGQISFIIIAI